MAGHSHWANIAHKKGIADKKRGKLFSKLSRYIIIAARNGGGDPATNLKLRYAIDKARAASVPKDTIEKAIKRGTGELGAETMEELSYEGYGPGGVAIFVDVLTDNRNRTNGEVRKIFERCGGNMGNPGCVGYLFDRKGIFLIDEKVISEDSLMNIILDVGADDMKKLGEHYEVTCDVSVFSKLQESFSQHNIPTLSSEIAQLPKTTVDVDVETGKKISRLMEMLDDHDDVQNVFTNANLTDEMVSE